MFILLFLIGLLIYYRVLSGYFFMDDFIFMKLFQVNNIDNFFKIFIPMRNIPYRPISGQLFFFIFQKIFGFNPLPVHIIIFFIHILNSAIVYQISLKFIKNSLKAKLISIMYAVSSIHFVGLYSISGSYFIFGVFFALLSFIFWLKYIELRKKYLYFGSLFFFLLSLFSAEIAILLPFIYLISGILKKRDFSKLIPNFLLIIINLFINYFYAGAPKTETYTIKLSSFFSLFKWYLLRAFGLPEGIKNGYQWEIFFLYLCFIFLLIIVFYTIITKRSLLIKKKKQLGQFSLWIIIAAFPFYFMPNHLNPIYFSLSFLGFLLLIALVIPQKTFNYFFGIFISMSFIGINLLLHTHWTVNRSILAKSWINKISSEYSDKPKDKIIISLPNKQTKDELKIIFQGSKALQLFYKDNNLETIYEVNKSND